MIVTDFQHHFAKVWIELLERIKQHQIYSNFRNSLNEIHLAQTNTRIKTNRDSEFFFCDNRKTSLYKKNKNKFTTWSAPCVICIYQDYDFV